MIIYRSTGMAAVGTGERKKKNGGNKKEKRLEGKRRKENR
jgi:hypothetical protein